MKVKELIEILSQQDPDMRVVVDGYETGYDEVEKVYQVKIVSNPKADIKIWEGDFDEVNLHPKFSHEPYETALCLPRKS
jgi:hypothetical protein